MCKTKPLYAVTFALSLTLSVIVNPWFFLLFLLTAFFDLVDGVGEVAKCEREYLWGMNDGPQTMQRIRMIKNKETGKTDIYVWQGGQDGFYSCNDKKYDRDLKEI